jgi:hypothetical protein
MVKFMTTKPDDRWYPKNLDWYVKWGATVLILLSVIFRQAGPDWRVYDLIAGTIGTMLWMWVSVMWKDRSLIVLNSVITIMLASALLREF